MGNPNKSPWLIMASCRCQLAGDAPSLAMASPGAVPHLPRLEFPAAEIRRARDARRPAFLPQHRHRLHADLQGDAADVDVALHIVALEFLNLQGVKKRWVLRRDSIR